MDKTKVRGVTKFNEFKSGNVIRVTLTNGQELRGLYAGNVKYEATLYKIDRVNKGQYMVIYNIKERKPEIVNVLTYCSRNNSHIQEVSSSRFKKELSDYLRAYHREYSKYQTQQKEAVEALTKSEKSKDKLKEVETGKLSEEIQKELEEEHYKENPKKYVKDRILGETGFSGYEQREGKFHLEAYLDKARYTYSSDLGASTYLEYDDTRHVDGDVDQKTAVRYLNRNGYPRLSLLDYKKVGEISKKIATFSENYIGMDVGEGDRVYPTINFTIEFKDIGKVSQKDLDLLIKNLKVLYNQVS